MLKGIHFLLCYMCNLECDHCFVYSGPNAKGTFTLSRIREVLDEAARIGTIEWIYFEGGEPFLFYPLMIEGIKIARDKGFKTAVVTNAYYGTSGEDAELWLRPLHDLGTSAVDISDDKFHFEDEENSPAKVVLRAAQRLGIPANSICIEKPAVEGVIDRTRAKGEKVVGGGAMFRGRAVEKLVEGVRRASWKEFEECPYEDLKEPKRVHVDPFGHVHLCQGLTMGNMWETPLSTLVKNYDVDAHPICGPLVRGGPVLLAEKYSVSHEDGYVDACHFCYLVRLALIDRFPEKLAPRQIYGLE
ncbi:MAG: radical SAM protein [bacterium]